MQASVQFIFILVQAIIYVCIVYFMAGFATNVGRISFPASASCSSEYSCHSVCVFQSESCLRKPAGVAGQSLQTPVETIRWCGLCERLQKPAILCLPSLGLDMGQPLCNTEPAAACLFLRLSLMSENDCTDFSGLTSTACYPVTKGLIVECRNILLVPPVHGAYPAVLHLLRIPVRLCHWQCPPCQHPGLYLLHHLQPVCRLCHRPAQHSWLVVSVLLLRNH